MVVGRAYTAALWFIPVAAVAAATMGCNGRVDEERIGRVGQRMAVGGLRVEAHHAEDGSATNNEIKPVLRIVNAGGTAISLSDLTLRYYFTSEGTAASGSVCYWAAVGCQNLQHQVSRLAEPAEGADSVLELRFGAGAGSLAPGASTGELKLAVHKSDWTAYNEADDHSYLAGATTFAAAPHVALFHESDLVWGTSPAGTVVGTGGASGTGGAGSGADGLLVSLQLPRGVGLHSVVLGGTEVVTVADGVAITASTPDGALAVTSVGTGETNLGVETRIAGDVTSVGPVKLRDRAVVEGDVTTAAELLHDAVWTVEGAVTEAVDLTPFTAYSWTVAFPPSGESRLAGPQQTVTLAPGAYANLDVHPGGVLELSAGTYTMSALRAESGSTVRLDFAGGPIFLYVRDTFTFRGRLEGADAAELFVGYLGAGTADIDAPFQGTVVAPNAHLRLSPVDGSGREGSFFARTIAADAHNPLVFTPFAHWDQLLPPELIVECLTRSASGYGAGVFGYLNRLDIPVEIPAGPRNSLSDSRLEKGPLEVFLPGEHRDAYSLPFRGPALEWTLDGDVARVDDTVERCTFDDYELVEVDALEPLEPLPRAMAALAVPFAPSPPLSPLVERAAGEDLTRILRAANGGAVDPETPGATAAESGGFTVLITTVGFKEEDRCTVGSLDVDLVVEAYREYPVPPA